MKLRVKSSKLKIGVVLFLFLIAFDVSAQSAFTEWLDNLPGEQIDVTRLLTILRRLTCRFVQFAIVAFAAMLVVYGIMFLKSRGQPGEIVNAKKAFSWGVIGGFIIFSVFTIVMTLATTILEVDFSDYPIPFLDRVDCS